MDRYIYQTAEAAYYDRLKLFAKEKRQYPTQAESILWDLLRGNRLGKPFRRQHVIGMFIADFVCLPSMLIIELDGGYHSMPGQQTSDRQRSEWLQQHGFKVVRFTNEEITGNPEHVLTIIKENLK